MQMSFLPLETTSGQESSEVCAPFVAWGQLKLSWPSDSHLGLSALIPHTQLERDPYGAPNVEDPYREYNIVGIATHPFDTSWFFSGESVPGVLENLTTNKDTHSVDPALGSFPLMVLSLWEEKSTQQQDYVRVQA